MDISEKAMMGRDGFLFLNGRDSNDLVGHLQGEISVLPSAHHIHRLNRAEIEKLSVHFLGIIVPEAHCIYPEKLPDGIVPPSPARPVCRVRKDMAEGYIYPLDMLLAFKAGGMPVYSGRDSHWTQVAALETYRSLRHLVGRNFPMELAFDPSNDPETGDLAMGSQKEVIAAERRVQRRAQPGYRTLFASRILNHGNVSVFHNPRGQGRCLAFGTSFSGRLVPAYASDFETVIFCYGTTIDTVMVDVVRPDCVIAELPERFLHFPALSVRGSTLIGLLLGLSETDNEVISFTDRRDVPDHLIALVQLLNGCTDLARGEATPHVLSQLEAVDMNLAHRVSLLRSLLASSAPKQALRRLLSGQFYNQSVLARAFRMVDSGQIGLREVDLMPESESGLLTLVRLYLRAQLPAHAEMALRNCIAHYGSSPEAGYFSKYLERTA